VEPAPPELHDWPARDVATLLLGGGRASATGAILWRDVDLANGRLEVGRDKTDPAFTLRVYSHAMRRSEDERAQLKALVEGHDWAQNAESTSAAVERNSD
jgi:hypothetical protein